MLAYYWILITAFQKLMFILFMGFSRWDYWSCLPFPVDHILSELSTMTRPPWVALHSMAHRFTELHKAVEHVISLISFLWLWLTLSALWCIRVRGLWKFPDGSDWLDLVLIGGAMLSKSLIQFSVDGQGCVPSLLLDLRPNYGGGNEDNGDLLQKVPGTHCYTQCLWPCSRPPLTHASAGDSWTLVGMSGSVSYGVTAPFSWVLVHTRFCLCPPRVSKGS